MQEVVLELKTCPYCKNPEPGRTVARRGDGVPVLRCVNCGLMWASEIPSWLTSCYDASYFDKAEHPAFEQPLIGYRRYADLLPVDFAWQQALLQLFCDQSTGTLLDLGCATGKFLALADEMGFEATGVEISCYAAEIAAKAGLNVINQPIEAGLPFGEAQFDVITAWDFFEHILDLRTLLSNCYRWLKPGGLLLFSTPDAGAEIVRVRKEQWIGFRSSLEHVLYLSAPFVHHAVGDLFGAAPVLVSFTYAGDYATLIGVVRKGGPSHSDWDRAAWLQNRTYPTDEKLFQRYAEPIAELYLQFHQVAALERMITVLESVGPQQLKFVVEAGLHLIRGQGEDAVRALRRAADIYGSDAKVWQRLYGASKRVSEALKVKLTVEEYNNRTLSDKVHHLQNVILAEKDRLLGEKEGLLFELKQQLTVKERELASLRADVSRYEQLLGEHQEGFSAAQRELMEGKAIQGSLKEQLTEKEQVVQALQLRLGWKRYRMADLIVKPYWCLLCALRPLHQRMSILKKKGFRALAQKATKRLCKYLKLRGLMSWYAFAFDTYKRARLSGFKADLRAVRCPSEPGLVSVVLPVYNGGHLLREALDSVLQQSYPNLELIAINDGSTDETPLILEAYAKRDYRVRVFHQENKKIPRTLSRGFRIARGEFLTWISHDNRLKPDFLERMVACIRRHPSWDMVYANFDIIGEEGLPLRNSAWYSGYQTPPGSEHIHLPEDPSELNTWANNYIGPAFLYRDRVAYLLGDYSPLRFTMEDYDYWMRINAVLNLRHTDFKDPIYEYRFHSRSLTHRDEELGITRNRIRLMVFDDFRRDFFLSPMVWVVEDDGSVHESIKIASGLRNRIVTSGHSLVDIDFLSKNPLPRLWVPVVYVYVSHSSSDRLAIHGPPTLPGNVLRVFVSVAGPLPGHADPRWDLCISTSMHASPPRLPRDYQGWLVIPDVDTLFSVVDIRAKSYHLSLIEAELERCEPPQYKVSVVVCTYRRGERLDQCIASLSHQTMPQAEYEVLIVNNDPGDEALAERVAQLRSVYFPTHPDRLRLLVCPLLGLSHARNAGIGEARGEIVWFMDDDAIAREDCLEQIWRAFEQHPKAGVVGGHIRLKIPEPQPEVLKPGYERFWSQFLTEHTGYTEVRHWWEFPWGCNWGARRTALLEVGGFRTAYGRRGRDFGGGEEIVAASLIQQLGYTVAVMPEAEVLHDVEPDRYTLNHIRRTIRAGILVSYQAQKMLHIPMESNLRLSIAGIKRGLMDLFAACFKYKSESSRYERWEASSRLFAYLELLLTQLADLFRRARRPISLHEPR